MGAIKKGDMIGKSDHISRDGFGLYSINGCLLTLSFRLDGCPDSVMSFS